MKGVQRVIVAAAFALSAVIAAAQQEAPPASAAALKPSAMDFSRLEIKTFDLGNKTYMLQGHGGNITIAVAANGVIMVDSQIEPLHQKIKAAVTQITKQPIRFLVNTQYHHDHTGGNAAFAADGVGIIAHANASKRLAAGAVNGLTGDRISPASEKALPSKTYGKATTLNLRGRKAELRHVPRAYTDGDTFVRFADANVIATGDIVTVGARYPNIDFANGGSINGMIAAVDAIVRLADENTRIVPGHGPVVKKSDLLDYRDMLATARDRMVRLIAQGRSESEVIEARPFADLDAKIGVDELASRNFIRVVYNSLRRK